MIIFGAGASHGSARIENDRLPLAQELLNYPAIAAKYPASRAVIDYLERMAREDTNGTLEDGLAAFGAIAEQSPERMKQLVAFRFYLCDVITSATEAWLSATHGRTYYLTLFNYLAEWQEHSREPIRLVTFNYDTLIEDALSSLFTDWRFDNMTSYISRRDWTLMKLHGSITWSRVGEALDDPIAPNIDRAIALAPRLDAHELTFEMTNPLHAPTSKPECIYLPALAVPMANKTSFECPPLHIEALRSCIPAVKRLLICGWRAAEAHMIDILGGINPGLQFGIIGWGYEDLSGIRRRLNGVRQKGHHLLNESRGMEALANNLTILDRLLAPWE